MKTIFSIILIFCSTMTFSQNWKRIDNSEIDYSNLLDEDQSNWYDLKFEYFKKEKTLIVVEKNFKTDLLELLTSRPDVFDSIVKVSPIKVTDKLNKSEFIRQEKSLSNVDFNEIVYLGQKDVVFGVKEIIWEVFNTSLVSQPPCWLNFVFNYSGTINSQAPERKLIFLSVFNSACDL